MSFHPFARFGVLCLFPLVVACAPPKSAFIELIVGTRTPDLYRVNPQFIDFSTTYRCSQGLLTSAKCL